MTLTWAQGVLSIWAVSPFLDTAFACRATSETKFGSVLSACFQVTSAAQDQCAVASINSKGSVDSSCLTLKAGGGCAVTSSTKSGSVYSSCQSVQNAAQDQCAVASINKKGSVDSDCLRP
jgi:hypothetical protein